MMKDQMTNINYDESNAAKLSSMFSEFENYSYKDLIIAESCIKQMNLVIPKNLLTQHKFLSLFKLGSIPIQSLKICSKLFIIMPCLEELKLCLKLCYKIISKCSPEQLKLIRLMIYVIPALEPYFEQKLEHSGLHGQVLLRPLPLHTFQIDIDLFGILSLPSMQNFSNSMFLGFLDMLNNIGHVPHICSIGSQSCRLLELAHETIEPSFLGYENESTIFGHLFVVDRVADLYPLFIKSLNYESLIADEFEMQFSQAKIPVKKVGKSESNQIPNKDEQKEYETVSTSLNGLDPLYSELRGLQITNVHNAVQDKLLEFSQRESSFQSNTKSDFSKVKNFVMNEMDEIKRERESLKLYLEAALKINDSLSHPSSLKIQQIEQRIIVQENYKQLLDDLRIICTFSEISPYSALRLICLLSLQFRSKFYGSDFESLILDFIALHGFDWISTILRLSALQILPAVVENFFETAQINNQNTLTDSNSNINVTDDNKNSNRSYSLNQVSSNSNWLMNKLKFKNLLTNEHELETARKNVLKFVRGANNDSSSFANQMLIPQLIQFCLNGGKLSEIGVDLNTIAGEYCELTAQFKDNSTKTFPRRFAVFMAGGVTHAELNELRKICQNSGYKMMVYAPAVLTSKSFLKNLTKCS